MSALMFASIAGNTETVKVLLQHGASLDLTSVCVRIYGTSIIIIVSLCVLCARMLGTSVIHYTSYLSLLVYRSLLVHSDLELYYSSNDVCVATRYYHSYLPY